MSDELSELNDDLRGLFGRSQRAPGIGKFDPFHLFICACVIGFHILLFGSGYLQRVENFFYDTFLRQRVPVEASQEIVLIQIEEDSIKAIGKWPWPWHYHTQMIKLLQEWQARMIIFNMPFSESTLPYESRTIEEDLLPVEELYLPVKLEAKPEKKIWVHALPIVLEKGGQQRSWTHSYPDIEKYAKGIGHINFTTDDDGVLRRIRPLLKDAVEAHPHLGLVAAGKLINQEQSSFLSELPLDQNGMFMINWSGPWKSSFTHYSFEDLIRSYQALKRGLRPLVSPESIRNKICIIGLTDQELGEYIVTPLESSHPSIGILANVLNGVLRQQFIIPTSVHTNMICLVIIGAVATMLFSTFRNVPSFIAGLALGGLWTFFSFLLFSLKGIWLPVFHPLLLILVLFIFSAIYGQIVTSRERSKLYDLATRDGLTGLFVIRHFRDILNHIVKDAKRSREEISIILIDIDNFKSINDKHGHPAGDMVLKKTAQIVQSCLRTKRPVHQKDFVARYGGEEFIVLVRNLPLEETANRIGERMRESVEKAAFEWKHVFIPVTISLGVGSLHEDEYVPDAMVHRADEALYKAKRSGKNRVCIED